MRPAGPLLALLLLAAAAAAQEAVPALPAAAETGLPDAQALLDDVIAAIPDVPLKAVAQLQSKDRDGGLERVLNVEMELDWRGPEGFAQYTLRDAFGENLEGLRIIRQPGGGSSCRHFSGRTLVADTPSDLYQAIPGMDFSWIDLSFAFLWWPGGKTAGAEAVKGRVCYTVDLPAPADGLTRYRGVRLWIDPKTHLLMRAVANGPDGAPLRQVEVRSLKKIRELWVVKDLEARTLATGHRTVLRVRDVEAQERRAP